MTEGTVKFFNTNRGFGFIAGDDGNEYFVHATGLKEGSTINEGDRVSFEVVQGDRGPKAEGVEKVSGAAAPAEESAEEAPAEEAEEEAPAEEAEEEAPAEEAEEEAPAEEAPVEEAPAEEEPKEE